MKNNKSIQFFVFLILMIPLRLTAQSDTGIYVGVLETIKITDAAWQNVFATPEVRVAFTKNGNKWSAMKTDFDYKAFGTVHRYYPSPLKWAVVYDGKKIGAIESENSGAVSWYSWIGLQKVISPGKIPTVTNGASNFYYQGNPCEVRPLLLTTGQNYKDPDQWKLTKIKPEEKKKMMAEFRKKEPIFDYCVDTKNEKTEPRPYPDNLFRFGERAFRSGNGVLLAGLSLDCSKNCSGISPDECSGHWFVIWPDGKIKYLGHGATPMDAEDFDNSGESQWIFYGLAPGIDDPDDAMAGYLLYYDNFTKYVFYQITYH